MKTILIIAMLSAASPGCSTSTSATDNGAQEARLTASGTAGYAHSFTRSKFRIGPAPRVVNEFGMSKNVGDHGVFAVITRSGMALGLPNADAPERAAAPLSLDPAVHAAAVVKYFQEAGIPAEEIGAALPYATMNQQTVAGSPPSPATLLHYTTVLQRKLAGVAVPDSIAYAQLNVSGDAVAEGVYWPPISGATIKAAIALRDKLADATSKATFLASLPGKPTDGEVAIRHTTGMSGAAFEEHAVVDVDDPNTHNKKHFDAAGARIVFADEAGYSTTGTVPTGDPRP